MTAPTPATNATFGPSICPAMGRCPVDHSLPRPPRLGLPGQCQRGGVQPFEPAYMQAPGEYLRWAREQEPVFSARSWATGW